MMKVLPHRVNGRERAQHLARGAEMFERICSIEGCERDHEARGYCVMHYKRWRKTGTTERPTREQRIWALVDKNGPVSVSELGPCWIWNGAKNDNGYGIFSNRQAHRITWEWHNERAFPAGLEPDHLCRVRSCVNPLHLEPVTHAENMRRARRTHCRRGHPLTPDNLVPSAGKRLCAKCAAANLDRYRNRLRQERGISTEPRQFCSCGWSGKLQAIHAQRMHRGEHLRAAVGMPDIGVWLKLNRPLEAEAS